MASGCILRNCWVCDEFIWEDEPWEIIEDELVHQNCVGKATALYRKLKALEDKLGQLETMLNAHSKETV